MTRLLTSTERAVYIAETPATPIDLATIPVTDSAYFRRMSDWMAAEFAAGNITKIDSPSHSPAGDPA